MTDSIFESCSWVSGQLPPYVDGELPHEMAQRVSRHLDHCAACRGKKQLEESRVMAAVESLVSAEPAPRLARRIKSELPAPVRLAIGRPLPAFFNLAAALILLAIAGGAALVTQRWAARPSPGASTPAVAVATGTTTEGAATTMEHPGLIRLLRGDIDGNGTVDLADLELLVRHVQSNLALDSLPCPAAGDFDGDDKLTVKDTLAAALAFTDSAPPTTFLFDSGPESGALACDAVCP